MPAKEHASLVLSSAFNHPTVDGIVNHSMRSSRTQPSFHSCLLSHWTLDEDRDVAEPSTEDKQPATITQYRPLPYGEMVRWP